MGHCCRRRCEEEKSRRALPQPAPSFPVPPLSQDVAVEAFAVLAARAGHWKRGVSNPIWFQFWFCFELRCRLSSHQQQLPLLELTGAAATPFLLLFLTSFEFQLLYVVNRVVVVAAKVVKD
ncbi:uncharacterized protein DS421_13g412520 [Arachis hypogaea]|nr:uncharacterized protein DS421_13g412520 [Arachis hypogaea]